MAILTLLPFKSVFSYHFLLCQNEITIANEFLPKYGILEIATFMFHSRQSFEQVLGFEASKVRELRNFWGSSRFCLLNQLSY